MLIKLIRWLRGYIIFSVSGSFPERFINLLNRSGITYWDLLPDGKLYSGRMLLSDYMKIRKTAKKSSVRLRCKKRVGFPFYIRKYRNRKGIAVGCILAVIVMAVLSQFVWDVQIKGAERLSISKLNSALDECGLKAGVLKSSVDFESVERELVLKVPQIRWISINALNSIAEIEIKEKSVKPKVKTEKYPCNLKASCDGVITKTLVYSGTCAVKRGSAVSENQLLVSCVVEGTSEAEGNLRYVHSNGKIFADVIENKSISIPLENNILIPSKNYIEKSTLDILWFNIPWKLDSSPSELKSNVFSNCKLVANEITLPLGVNTVRTYDFEKSQKKLSVKKAKILIKKKACLKEAFNYGNYKIKSKKYSLKELNGKLKLNAEYVVNKNIAVEQRVKINKKVE